MVVEHDTAQLMADHYRYLVLEHQTEPNGWPTPPRNHTTGALCILMSEGTFLSVEGVLKKKWLKDEIIGPFHRVVSTSGGSSFG